MKNHETHLRIVSALVAIVMLVLTYPVYAVESTASDTETNAEASTDATFDERYSASVENDSSVA